MFKPVSDYIERHLGQQHSFRTIIADPSNAPGVISAKQSPFAKITADILLRLGGDYARLVRESPNENLDEGLELQEEHQHEENTGPDAGLDLKIDQPQDRNIFIGDEKTSQISTFYDWDIFISYTYIDNQDLSEEEKGWIDYLHERLATRLAQLLGEHPKIWRDRKLGGNDIFNDVIKEVLNKAAIFVAVMSPRYLKSSSCQQEVNYFTQFAQAQGGMRVGNKSRVFKVIKTEVPLIAHPPTWQNFLGYEFYGKDSKDRTREFDHLLTGKQRDKRYWDKFEDLANDIKDTLLTLQTVASPQTTIPPAAAPHNLPIVYLICDQQDYDDTKPIEDFLNDYGCEVLQPPLGSDDQQSLQQYHLDNLKLCDAVLIYHGHAPPMWAQIKLQDLLKLSSLGRTQPLLAKALYLGAPQNSQKEHLRARDTLLIKGYEGFTPDKLEPFLAKLREAFPRMGTSTA